RMDPNNADLYNVVGPSTSVIQKEANPVRAPSNDEGGMFHGLIYDRWVSFAGDLHQLTGAGNSLCLASPPNFTMSQCHIFYGGDDTLHSTDGTEADDTVAESELIDGPPGVRQAGRLRRASGALRWKVQPKPGDNDARFDLEVNMPVVYTGITSFFGE